MKSQRIDLPHSSQSVLTLDGASLTIPRILTHLSDPRSRIAISKRSVSAIERSSRFFDRLQQEGTECYGLNTGFGDLIGVTIAPENHEALQRRLVLSHAVGCGEVMNPMLARMVFLLRLNSIASGASGIRPSTVEHMVRLYNGRAYPEIPLQGSLGASGDLSPLSHFAAFLMGRGWGTLEGRRLRAPYILSKLRVSPVVFDRKEALSIINGTSASLAIAIHALTRFDLYVRAMLVGMSVLLTSSEIGTDFALPAAFELKGHPGSKAVARYLFALTRPRIRHMASSGQDLQPIYSIRCAPHILGPAIESARHLADVLTTESNSVSDNPIYLARANALYHGGHFHGHPISVATDQFRVAVAHVTGLMDRQLEFFFDRRRNSGRVPFLSYDVSRGYCGLEGAQYLLTSLHVKNKGLASPYSVLTVPTNAGNQDYVSLSMHSAVATDEMMGNIHTALGVYLLAAAQFLALYPNAPVGRSLKSVSAMLTNRVSLPYRDDRLLTTLIDKFASDEFFSRIVQATVLGRVSLCSGGRDAP